METRRRTEDAVFDAVAGCTLVVAALLVTALLVHVMAVVFPIVERAMFPRVLAEGAPKTLVAVLAHADDETVPAPVLARYAREGARVYVIIATDGAQGGAHTSIPTGPELARVRSDEARCSAAALGIEPPILLGFPDAQLGSYLDDRDRLPRLTSRIQEELAKLRPDALVTWAPDGGTGHPDHRLVSSIVTQLVQAGAPDAPEHLFYVTLPPEAVRSMNANRPGMADSSPLAKYMNARIAFTDADAEAARRAMHCHKTQYSDAVVERISTLTRNLLKGEFPLMPSLPAAPATDLFR